MKKVTVIMPCLNVVQYFKECIDSVVNQTIFKDLEVLIVDAGSTDGTQEMAMFYATKYPNIQLKISEKKSYGYQVNLGIKEASSKYVAILETDDYVREDMYELLYNVAEEKSVDYVKADYDMFYICRNNKQIFKKMVISKSKSDYNKVLDMTKNKYMHVHDFSVWKGIYHREFLINNKIYFNESPGAAYQDIGFGQILHSHAKRALYLPDSLYRYRVGREQSSVNSGKGIIYNRNEFERLLHLQDEYELFMPGLYEAMLSSFLGEFGLLDAPTAASDHNILDCAYWIVNHIDEAIRSGIISEEMICQDLGEDKLLQFRRIQKDIPGEMEKHVRMKREQRRQWTELSYIEEPIYIFGAGNYGMNALRLLDSCGVQITGFLDNGADENKQIAGYDVILPTNRIVGENARVIIANKFHADEIRKQLVDMGVDEAIILEYKN